MKTLRVKIGLSVIENPFSAMDRRVQTNLIYDTCGPNGRVYLDALIQSTRPYGMSKIDFQKCKSKIDDFEEIVGKYRFRNEKERNLLVDYIKFAKQNIRKYSKYTWF